MESNYKNNGRSRLMLITSMVIFGTIGIFRRHIDVSSALLAVCRGYIGAVSLLIITLLSGKNISTSAIKKNFKWLIISGCMIGINWILLFEAYNYTTVAVATLCYYMAPVFVMAASPIFLKEKLTLRKVLCMLLALAGMMLISGIFNKGNESPDFRGIIYGIGAAGFYASVIMLNQKIRDISAYDKTMVQLAAAATVLIPYIIAGNNAGGGLKTVSLAMIVFVGLVHTGLAYALYFGSMDSLSAQTVALYGYIDPIVAIILSSIILSEKMGVPEIVGTICILAGTILSER